MSLQRALVGLVACVVAPVAWAQPRSIVIADRAAEVRDWVYYRSPRELSPEVREIFTRLVDQKTVGVGEPVSENDVVVEPANAQLQFAAVGGGLTVLVFYANGGIIAKRMHMLIYDAAAGDACRYVFSRNVRGGADQLRNLLRSIRQNGADDVVRVEYLESDALTKR